MPVIRPALTSTCGWVVDEELTAVDAVAQVVLEGEPLDDRRAELLGEGLAVIAPLLLSVVHGDVGVGEKGPGAGAGGGESRDADARRDMELMTAHEPRLTEALEDALGDFQGTAAALDGRQEQHELVAADARDRVTLPDKLRQLGADQAQQRVPFQVTGRIVHDLEPVEVEEHYRHHLPLPFRLRQRHVEAVHQQRPVGQAGEGVVIGDVTDLLLRPLLLADVQHGADHALRLAALGEKDARLAGEPVEAAVRPEGAEFRIVGSPVPQRAGDLLLDPLAILGMDAREAIFHGASSCARLQAEEAVVLVGASRGVPGTSRSKMPIPPATWASWSHSSLSRSWSLTCSCCRRPPIKESAMRLKDPPRLASSSRPAVSARLSRSPSATRIAFVSSAASGFRIERATRPEASRAREAAPTPEATSSQKAASRACFARASSRAASSCSPSTAAFKR